MESVKKRNRLRLPARAGVWNIVSGLVARGVGVAGTPLFTRLLTPAEYGLYPLYLTWLSVATALAAAGLTGSAIYRGLQRYSRERDRFICAATGLGLSSAVLLLIVGLPLSRPISRLTGLEGGVLIMLVCEIALSTVISLRSSLLRYEYRYKALALTNLFSAIGTPLISVALLILTPYRAEARIIGSLIATAAVALPTLAAEARRAPLWDGEIWRYLLRVNLPLLPHYLSSSLILRISEMVIGRTHGEAALAKYSVGISVGLALTFLTNALSQAGAPWVLRKVAAKEHERVRQMTEAALGALMCVSLILLAAAPEILSLITPPEYADALPAVYPLALSVSAMFLSGVIMSAEAYYERSARSALPTVITAAISAIAATALLPRIDYRFSSLFTLAAYLILLALSHFVFKKISGESVIKGQKCALIFAFGIIYALILFVFRGVLLSRILLAATLLPTLWHLSRSVLEMVRER